MELKLKSFKNVTSLLIQKSFLCTFYIIRYIIFACVVHVVFSYLTKLCDLPSKKINCFYRKLKFESKSVRFLSEHHDYAIKHNRNYANAYNCFSFRTFSSRLKMNCLISREAAERKSLESKKCFSACLWVFVFHAPATHTRASFAHDFLSFQSLRWAQTAVKSYFSLEYTAEWWRRGYANVESAKQRTEK